MTRDAALFSKMFELTRGDLERAVPSVPDLGELTAGLHFVRIRGLGAFWHGDMVRPDALSCAVSDLLTGLYARGLPCAAVIRADGREVQYWFGAAASSASWSLRSLVAGTLPGAEVDITPWSLGASRPVHAVALTGRPSGKRDERGVPVEQIDAVIRSLQGRAWLFMVRAEPVDGAEVVRAINDVTGEIREVIGAYLLRQSGVDETDRTAKRYVELLETKLQQLEQARSAGQWRTRTFLMADSQDTVALAGGLLCSAFGGVESVPDPFRCHTCSTDGHPDMRAEHISTPDLALLVCPPRTEHPGYEVVEFVRYGVNAGGPSRHQSVPLGDIVDGHSETGNHCVVALDDLVKHTLVAGVTGSGKTNTCLHLLVKAREMGVPSLIIESAKAEYRTLLRAAGMDDLVVFTLGNEMVAPFRLNPFEVPASALVQTHIDYLKALFNAAFVLYPPMPYVLEQSLQEVYEDSGWNIARNSNDRGAGGPWCFPTLSDLAAKVPQVVRRMGYDQRITMDVQAGLLARINQLRLSGGKGLMLDTRSSVPDSVLFERSCLLELKSIVSDDEKAFVIGLVLARLYERCEARQEDAGLRHLTLIEEAHRLLRNTSTEQFSDVAANPRGRAIEVFANMLSEVRAYGEGIVLAEQVPTKLVPDAIKNTNLKVIHRLVAADDRALVGNSMRLTERQQRGLALLETGEAVVFREGLANPVKVRVPRVSVTANAMDDTTLAMEMARFYDQHAATLDRVPVCATCPNRTAPTGCRHRQHRAPSDGFARTFQRWFNDLRLSEHSLLESYRDLRQESEAAQSTTGLAWECSVRLALYDEVSRRGRLLTWSFEQCEHVAILAVDAIRSLEVADGVAVACKTSDESGRFADRMRDLETRARPFPGCGPCRHPCRFRLDLLEPVERYRATFRKLFRAKSVSWADLVSYCRNAANDAFPCASPPIAAGAALCFAIQQLASMGDPPSLQRRLSDKMLELFTSEAGYAQS